MFRLKPLALAVAAALAFAGCEPTAVNTRTSIAQERQQGVQLVRQLEARDGIVEDASLNAYVRSIVNRIERQRPPGSVPITAHIVKDADVNAFTPGGGELFLNAGIIAAMQNEAQLATVVAHEIAHVDLGHIQAGQARQAGVQLGAAAAQIGGALLGLNPDLVNLGVGLGANAAISSFTRTQERQADERGIRYVAAAGYNALEGARSFDVMRRISGGVSGPAAFFQSHPAAAEREQTLAALARQLGATRGYVGEREYDRETRALREAALQYYQRAGRAREAAVVSQNLR